MGAAAALDRLVKAAGFERFLAGKALFMLMCFPPLALFMTQWRSHQHANLSTLARLTLIKSLAFAACPAGQHVFDNFTGLPCELLLATLPGDPHQPSRRQRKHRRFTAWFAAGIQLQQLPFADSLFLYHVKDVLQLQRFAVCDAQWARSVSLKAYATIPDFCFSFGPARRARPRMLAGFGKVLRTAAVPPGWQIRCRLLAARAAADGKGIMAQW